MCEALEVCHPPSAAIPQLVYVASTPVSFLPTAYKLQRVEPGGIRSRYAPWNGGRRRTTNDPSVGLHIYENRAQTPNTVIDINLIIQYLIFSNITLHCYFSFLKIFLIYLLISIFF